MNKTAEQLTKRLMGHGKIIEAGFLGFKKMAISEKAPDVQIQEMRVAFFAGASHLFASIMTVLEDGDEPSDNDLKRLSLIDAELREFEKQFSLKHLPTTGGIN